MGQLEDAHKILANTEASLRELIERALAEQQYSHVADIARIADAVARLLRNNDKDPLPAAQGLASANRSEWNGGAVSAPVVQETPTQRATRKRHPAKGEYPRFERDGDKLIKIGWSKRDNRVYEHRASRETVFLVSTALSSKVKPKAIFTMDQVLRLRSIGAVQRRGKDGYSLTNGSLDSGKLRGLWNAIPSRH